MGFISNLAQPKQKDSKTTWREVFGGTNKEESQPPEKRPVVRGGSYGRSVVAESAAIKRLVQAMESMAPGGWSDDRWEQSKHWTGITYVAGHRSAEQMAQSEFQIFVRDDNHPDGKRPVRKYEEGYKLVKLLEKPNNQDTFGDLMYRWDQQLTLTGKALTWMVPNMLRVPYSAYSIPTAIAIPQPAINPDYPDGYYRIQPVYPYGPFSSYPTPSTAVGAPIPAQWMMEFKYPHPILRYDGYSPLTGLRLHIDELESMDRSRWYSMKRSINPSAVLQLEEMEGSSPLAEEEIERIRAEFEQQQEGPENHGNLHVAAPGGRLEPWGNKPVDMDYQQGWDQLLNFIIGGLGVTKPAAGMVEDSSYATLFATLKQFHLLTLGPKLRRISAGLTRHLAPFFGDHLIVEVRCPRIDDHEVLNGKLSLLMQAKAITKNEMRKQLEFPITKEAWGEEIAGADSQQEQQQMGMPGMEQQAQMPQQEGPNTDEAEQEYLQGEPEAEAQRPDTNTLGENALGPRKHLRKRFHLNGRHK